MMGKGAVKQRDCDRGSTEKNRSDLEVMACMEHE